jgi:hypothetical protein
MAMRADPASATVMKDAVVFRIENGSLEIYSRREVKKSGP